MRRPLPARSIIVENYFVFANDIGGKYFSIEALKVQPLIHSLAVRGRESYWTEIRLILLDDGTNGPWTRIAGTETRVTIARLVGISAMDSGLPPALMLDHSTS